MYEYELNPQSAERVENAETVRHFRNAPDSVSGCIRFVFLGHVKGQCPQLYFATRFNLGTPFILSFAHFFY